MGGVYARTGEPGVRQMVARARSLGPRIGEARSVKSSSSVRLVERGVVERRFEKRASGEVYRTRELRFACLRRFVAWPALAPCATLGVAAMNVSACFGWSAWWRPSAVAFGFAFAAFVACTSKDPPSDEPEGDPADCRLIANRCHPYAPESELAHECHETGHDGAEPARCTERKASCLDECPERDPDAGTGGSSGATSTGGSSGTTSSGGTAGATTGGASGEGGTTTGGAAGESSGGASGASSGGSAGGSQGGAAGSTSTGGSAGTSSGGSGMAGGSGSGGTTGETPCELLGRLCHEAGPGRAEECHEIGHEGDEDVCEEELAECLAVCQDGGM